MSTPLNVQSEVLSPRESEADSLREQDLDEAVREEGSSPRLATQAGEGATPHLIAGGCGGGRKKETQEEERRTTAELAEVSNQKQRQAGTKKQKKSLVRR